MILPRISTTLSNIGAEVCTWAYYSTYQTRMDAIFVIEFTLMSRVDGLGWLMMLKTANLFMKTQQRRVRRILYNNIRET